MTLALDSTMASPRARRRWLRAPVGEARALHVRATAFVVLDVLGAIAFAAGLSLILSPKSQGASPPLWGAALALAGVLWRGVCARLASGAGAKAARSVKAQLRRYVVQRALNEPAGSSRPLGETMTVVADGVQALEGQVARFGPYQTAGAISPLLIAAVVAIASPVAALIIVLTFIPFAVAMALAGAAAAGEAERQFDALGKLSGLFVDRLRALPVILAFQAEEVTTQALAVSARRLAARTLAVLRIAFLSSAVLEFFAALSVALVAVYCGFSLLHLLPFPGPEQLDLRRAIFVLALAPEAYLPMRRLAAAYHDRQAAEAAVPVLAPMVEERAAAPRRILTRAPSIRFDHVSVIYPDRTEPGLADLDFDLASGGSIALVGPSGSGKSTALYLLLGLLAPTHGRVWVDGAPVGTGAPLAAWAGQAPLVIPGDLFENIALVRQDASPQEVVLAARRAGLLNIPGGLERRIDERGGGLSGGEKRRLGLARAFLSEAPLLLLDEPTANLDLASEMLLLPVIRLAMQGRTTLIATHSKRVAALADQVIQLGEAR